MDKASEVLMWHIALDRSGKLQPIMAVRIPFNLEIIKKLLQTDNPGIKKVDIDSDYHYYFAYDNNLKRPYPSVMIFRHEVTDKGDIIIDMSQEDLRAVSYASGNYLRA